MIKVLPRNEYFKQLPKKIIGAGVIIRNSKNEILIVKPSYHDRGWLMPGGSVEENESLQDGATREVLEEVGIKVELKKILLFEYKHHDDSDNQIYDSLLFYFLGKSLSDEDIKKIRIDNDEIIDFKFVDFKTMLKMITPSLKRRLEKIKNFDNFYYLEHGEVIFER